MTSRSMVIPLHCHRCLDIEAGAYGTKAHHADECRLRIDLKYEENNDMKWRDVESQLSRQAKPAGDKEEIRLGVLRDRSPRPWRSRWLRRLLCQRAIISNPMSALLMACKLQAIHLADPAKLSRMAAKMLMRHLTFVHGFPRGRR